MKRSISICLALVCFSLILVIGTLPALAASYTKDKPLVLRFNTVVKSEGAPGSASQQTFKTKVEELTNNTVKVEYFYGWSLANNTEAVIGGLQTNSFHVSDWSAGSFAEYSKAFLPLDVPYLIAGEKAAFEVIRGDVGRMMAERLVKDTGVRALMIGYLGFRHITNSKRPINSAEDLKGLKIRTQSNPLHIQGFKAFGALPTPMAFAELFTALQQGVVDGQENPIYNIFSVKFYEVQKYLSLTSHICSLGAFIMGDDFYQSLPQDIQKAIDTAAVEARESGLQEIVASENVWLSQMADKIKINKLSDDQILAFQKVAKAEWPKMAEAIGPDYFNAIQSKLELIQSK